MRRWRLVAVASTMALCAMAARNTSKNPMDIAGSRLGITKAEVLTNAATAPVGYGNVRQGLDSVSFLVTSVVMVVNEQGEEYGSAVEPESDDGASKTYKPKAGTGKSKTEPAKPSGPELPAGMITKTVHKTFYFDKFGRTVALQVSFENLNRKDLAELLKALDEKYTKDIQKQTDIYTFSLSNFVKLECRVRGTAFRSIGNDRQQPIRFQVFNLYYDEARLQKTLRSTNDRNGLGFKDLI